MTKKLTRETETIYLSEIIREVDGSHSLGAAALAEAILEHPSVNELKFNVEVDDD